MSGFDGRISFEGDTARGKQLLGVAIKHANVQRQNKNILGLATSIKTYDLGGGAYCIVVDLGHMRAMHIVSPVFHTFEYEYEDVFPEGGGGPGVYDVLAGYTQDPTIVKETTTDPKTGKKTTTERLQHFYPTNRTLLRHPNDKYRRARLAVKENPIFAPVEDPSDKVYSEHAHVKPSNFSGSMREVVQVLMGIGKIMRPTAEQNLHLPGLPAVGKDLISKQPRQMVSAFGLYDKKESPITPRVDFDYRVSKTHGITFDNDGVAWVIEIGQRGVHAMRLYLDPVSMTYQGAERYIKVSPELKDFIFKFGGMPLGITLPTFELFDKMKRAGEVTQLISEVDMRVFNTKSPYGSDCGWCFSPMGTEAHNTCWEWGLDFVKKGFHYGISINLTDERFEPWTPKRSELAGHFVTVWEVNKCRRMKEGDAKGILAQYDISQEAGDKAFDILVVNPSLKGSARITLQRMGSLYHPAKFQFQPQFKYPEQLIGALLSFDFADAGDSPDSPRRTYHKVKCDTPMYVCFIQGQLDVLCYAYDNTQDNKPMPAESDTDREECQAVGGWTDTSTDEGEMVVQGNFYSNRWDFRREQRTGGVTVTKNIGTKITAWPMAGSEFFFSTTWYAWTTVACYVDSEQTHYPDAPSRALSCSAVMRDRCAYYMAVVDTFPPGYPTFYSGRVESYGTYQKDEWSVYHFVLAWVGGPHCPPQDWVDQAPMSCIAHKRCLWFDDKACFTDNLHQDFWINACSPGPGWTAGFEGPKWETPILPNGYNYRGPQEDGDVFSTVYFVNDTVSGETIAKLLVEKTSHGSSLSEWWWRASPDEAGFMPTIQAVNSCLGGDVSNFMDDMDGDVRHKGVPEYLQANWHVCYTGVIE